MDYRKTLIYLTVALYQTTTHDVRTLLATLYEMVEIFYARDRKRSPKLILRLHNLCWRHAILCQKVMTPTTALTSGKLFCICFHACVSHSAFLLCLASHHSTNTEKFEKSFEELTVVYSNWIFELTVSLYIGHPTMPCVLGCECCGDQRSMLNVCLVLL